MDMLYKGGICKHMLWNTWCEIDQGQLLHARYSVFLQYKRRHSH